MAEGWGDTQPPRELGAEAALDGLIDRAEADALDQARADDNGMADATPQRLDREVADDEVGIVVKLRDARFLIGMAARMRQLLTADTSPATLDINKNRAVALTRIELSFRAAIMDHDLKEGDV